ncbi:uncharacterized protein [Aquarana catesbeiana]|uniref:uncharacterized protein isoform X2 n=1 Tax=Aquarana catesbeiana TaxID=8400 RepID=UPI003CC98DF1
MSGINRKFRVRRELGGSREETLLELAAEEKEDPQRPTTKSRTMDGKQDHMTEKILNLTLEIIYLLTGESFPPVKSGDHLIIKVPQSLKPKGDSDRKILELTNKITELLTGEVPIRCQDVTVYFSMEEWEYLEGHKDLYKDVMMDNQPPLTSPDGSSNGNPPERCPRPLYSRDSTQEDDFLLDQREELRDNNVGVKEEEEESYVRDGLQSMEEDLVMVTTEHEESSLNISTDGSSNGNPPERCPRPLYSRDSTQEGHCYAQCSQAEDLSELKIKIKEEEEETYVMGNLFMEEAGTMVTVKEEDSSPDIRSDDIIVWKSSMGHPFPENFAKREISSPGSMGRSLDPRNPEESSPDKSSSLVHQQTHNENHPFICSECGKCFQTKSNLIRHENVHIGKRPYSCSECGKDYTAKSHLDRHKKSHTGDRPYSCPECGKCFKQKDRLYAHRRIHKGETRFSCVECKKSFIDKAHFVSHLRVHTGERPFACPECGKSFSQKGHLNIHLRLHTGEKAFACPECGKRFTHKSTLVNHQRFHTGEQPFSCTVCGKRFTRKMSLERHQKLSETSLSCVECGMPFNTKCEMKIHQRSHPKKRTYQCPDCPKSYIYQSELLRHQKAHTT